MMEIGLGPQDVEVDTGTGEGEATGNFLSTKFHFSTGNSYAIIPFQQMAWGLAMALKC